MTALTKLNTNMCNRRWLFYALSSFTRCMNKQMNKLFLSVFLSLELFEKTDRRVSDVELQQRRATNPFIHFHLSDSWRAQSCRSKCSAKLLKKMSLLLFISVSVFPSFSTVCSLHSNRLSYVCRGSISQYIVILLPVFFSLPFCLFAHFV